VNDNIAVTSNMFCLEDGDEARAIYAAGQPQRYQELFFHYLDSFPRPPGLGEGPLKLPATTAEGLKAGMLAGGIQVGAPDEVASVLDRYAAVGVDQMIYAPLCHSVRQKDVLRSIECFGKHVLPRFDKDPVHRTTRLREAALRDRAAA
jgi:alkanesulfonate monooxygenase SsuD/methylene tetrahydromethanopterin reductase-like flavin-dependent oxidoreductase (luciferase family)